MKICMININKWSSRVALYLVLFVVSLMVTGCASDRIITTVRVNDYGSNITTRFQYRLFNRPDLEPTFEKLQPNVFSKNGIPVKLNDNGVFFGKMEVGYRPDFNPLSYLACKFSLGVLPALASHNSSKHAVIENVGPDRVNRTVEMDFDYRMALTITSPLGLIYLDNNESVPSGNGYRVFKMSGSIFSLVRDACNDNIQEAMVYGVASRLKEMEDSGVIDVNFVKRMDEKVAAERARRAQLVAEMAGNKQMDRMVSELRNREEVEAKKMAIVQEKAKKEFEMTQNGEANKPPYRITMLERDGNSDFAYVFALKLNGEPSIRAFFALQGIFCQEVLDAYRIEHPKADVSKLRVVVKPRLDNGVIRGRAEVLTIVPLSLVYGANSRRGRLSVKFSPGQENEARNWAKENIETLARDKNIALVTGQLPPEATCYSLGEKIDGNVMEIEFKTE